MTPLEYLILRRCVVHDSFSLILQWGYLRGSVLSYSPKFEVSVGYTPIPLHLANIRKPIHENFKALRFRAHNVAAKFKTQKQKMLPM